MFNSNLKSQTINIDSTFTADAEIYPFSPNDTITGLSISGSIELNSDTSLVRVILGNEDSLEFIVYEAYPMIAYDYSYSFLNNSDETEYMNGFTPEYLKIYIVNSVLTIDSIYNYKDFLDNLDSLQYASKKANDAIKVAKMAIFLQNNGMTWTPGDNSIVSQYYHEKKCLFGPKYNLLGLDYYVGGIYRKPLEQYPPVENDDLVKEFSWISKHDADSFGSPYYNDDHGWITPVEDQNPCGSCYAFAATGMLETMTNLYFNYHIDIIENLDLSEAEVYNCSQFCDCSPPPGPGGSSILAINYLYTDGVVNESCYEYLFPYCDRPFPNPSPCDIYPDCIDVEQRISATDKIHLESLEINEENLKKFLIDNGPVSFSDNVNFGQAHNMILVGFEYDEENDNTIWIIKNSWGSTAGVEGYLYMPIADFGNNNYSHFYGLQTPIVAHIAPSYEKLTRDEDKDGYYNWGIGDKAGWTPPYSSEEDWNDNDPRIGPRDENYYGIPVKPILSIECAGQVISDGEFFTFYEDSEDLVFEITIQNYGNANLNLFPINAVTSSNNAVYEIEEQPSIIIPMNEGEESFSILYHFYNGPGVDKSLITITFNEIDIDPFEFTIINLDCTYDPAPEIVSHITTWDDWDIKVSDVIVETNSELTITGRYGFVEEASLIIEPGARVIINGGQLTKACSDAWQGIDVWGNSSLSQYPSSNQGHLVIKNGGCIEYAKEAIQVARIQNRQYMPGTTGGIVQCNDAVFRNDTIGVLIYPYDNFNPSTGGDAANKCQFQNTKFITVENFCKPNSHVSLWGVDGVLFKGCDFKNEVLKNDCLIGGYEKGFGIKSFNAGFSVCELCLDPSANPCKDVLPCTFSNLDHAIYALNAEFNEPIRIENASLINNQSGIYMSLVSQQSIVGNSFIIDENHDLTGYGSTDVIGLNLEQCRDFSVEENNFTKIVSNIAAGGLQVLNAGPYYHEIYNNSFSGLTIGIIAAGENRNGSEEGLCIICNDFNECITDIYVTPDGGTNQNYLGIALQQGEANGSPDGPASNTFTYDPQFHINNTTLNSSNYAHHVNHEEIKLEPTEIVNINPQIDEDAQYSKELSCPSNIGIELLSISNEMSQISNENQQISAYNDTLNQYVDGGDTEGLNFDVQITMPTDALQTTQELLSESPYLSDTVMESTIAKESVFPNAMVRDVLVANPHSAKRAEILNALDDRFVPMPDYMMAEIMQGQNTMGAKEIIEQKKTKHIVAKTKSLNKLLRYYMQDTLVPASNDSILALLEGEPSLTAQYQRAFLFLEDNDTVEVLNILNNIPDDFELTNRESTAHDLYCDLFDVLIEIYSDTLPMDSLHEAALLAIEQYDHLVPGVYARNILIHYGSIDYIEPVYLANTLQNYQEWGDEGSTSNTRLRYLRVFPNPASNYFIVEYDLRGVQGESLLQLMDESGRLVRAFEVSDKQNQQVISTSGLSSGIYVIQLYINNDMAESYKLGISK